MLICLFALKLACYAAPFYECPSNLIWTKNTYDIHCLKIIKLDVMRAREGNDTILKAIHTIQLSVCSFLDHLSHLTSRLIKSYEIQKSFYKIMFSLRIKVLTASLLSIFCDKRPLRLGVPNPMVARYEYNRSLRCTFWKQ